MTRNEIITSINDLFDKNIELEHQLRTQSEYYDNLYTKDSNGKIVYKMSDIQQKLYDIGLKHLFDEGFKPSYSMKYYGNNNYFTFEEWVDKSIDLDKFNDITKNEFIKLFSEKIKAEYERRLVKEKQKEKEEE